VLFCLAAEAKLVDEVERVAQRVAAGELVLQLGEHLADLVFDGARFGPSTEPLKVGEQLAVDVVDEVRAGERAIVVELAGGVLGRGPVAPAMRRIDDRRVGLAGQFRLQRPFGFEVVEVLEKEQPAGLLDVVQLGGAARLLPEDVVDVAEGLFEHGD
jgi:hypothetical protein